MKNQSAVKIEGPLEPWALGVVSSQPGFEAAWRTDGQIVFDGHRRPVIIEVKRRVDSAQAHAVVSMARTMPPGRAFLLVAEEVSARARELLEANGVAFVDAMGNATIRLPGVFVRTGSFAANAVTARRPPSRARLAGKGGVIAQALLLNPERHWKIEELATESMVSAGLAHRILARLEEIGLVESHGSGPTKDRQLANPGALLDLWAEEDREIGRIQTPGYTLARPGTRTAITVSERLEERGIAHAVTGGAAAALVAPAVTATPVTEVRVTAAQPPARALDAAGARPADEGYNVLLVQTPDDLGLRFRRQSDGAWLAANPRIYLDLLRDPRRGREQAVEFRQRAFGF